VRDDRLFKICELYAAVKIGKPAVMSIVVELGYRTFCERLATKIIMVKIKIKYRKTVSAEILQRSEKVGDACLSRIITGDGICVHY
jgi:hypothetical protein